MTLLPMTDTPVETHVVVTQGGEQVAIHFGEWWVRHQAALDADRFVVAGLDSAAAAPGVLEAIRSADVVLLPPSNPVVSIGIILGVPGIRDALRGTRAPVVGVSPLVGGRPVRGHADVCLRTIGVDTTGEAIAGLCELPRRLARRPRIPWRARTSRLAVVARPLLMSSVAAAADIAGAGLAPSASGRRARQRCCLSPSRPALGPELTGHGDPGHGHPEVHEGESSPASRRGARPLQVCGSRTRTSSSCRADREQVTRARHA